jgi:hypothetical protein
MKSEVLARPNLKFFIISGIIMLFIQHFVSSGLFSGRAATGLFVLNAGAVTDTELDVWLRQARENPSVAAYVRISHVYERRGDYKRALQYLRRAEKVGSLDE